MNSHTPPPNEEPSQESVSQGNGPDYEGMYKELLGELAQLEEARLGIETKMERVKAAVASIRKLMPGDDTSKAGAQGADQDVKQKKRKRYREGSKPLQTVTRAKAILMKNARPMTRVEILAEMRAEGLALDVNEADRFVGRMLREDPDFIHVPRKGYWLTDKPLPAL